jgi:hypothetical protein
MARLAAAPRNSPNHLGTFMNLNKSCRVFYKCPPSLVSREALDLFGITHEEYTMCFEKPQEAASNASERYFLNIAQNSPYMDCWMANY